MSVSPFVPPSRRWVDLATQPLQFWFTPSFSGWQNLPDHRRLLFVGNHTIYGLLDAPLLFNGLYQERGLLLRSLGDRIHFRVPLWRDLLLRHGAVEGNRATCSRLMQSGEPVLVFPGGGREVCKRKGEAYRLIWKSRAGFAAMAAEHDYTIVPFAAVGAEECFDILWDADDWARLLPEKLRNGAFYRKLLRGGDGIFPLAKGVGPTLLPRPVAMHFRFGQPISAGGVDAEDAAAVWALREQTRAAVETLLVNVRSVASEKRPLSGWRRWLIGAC